MSRRWAKRVAQAPAQGPPEPAPPPGPPPGPPPPRAPELMRARLLVEGREVCRTYVARPAPELLPHPDLGDAHLLRVAVTDDLVDYAMVSGPPESGALT